MLPKISDYALYTPSISAEFAKIGFSNHLKRTFSFPETDLNFLDPRSGLFHYPYALYSAGQAAQTDAMAAQVSSVSSRDRAATTVIGDSGGYQIQQGTIKFEGDATSERALRWMEKHADFAMTLDFPTGGIQAGNVAPHVKRLSSEGVALSQLSQQNGLSVEYNACLQQSLINLDYFVQHRRQGATNFLNVLQGRNELESKTWYDAVKGYNLEGWAFAGTHQASFTLILNRILDMLDDGHLEAAKWFHFLGISTLGTAYLFNTILRCIRKINVGVGISFDTSTPSKAAANFRFFPNIRYDKFGSAIEAVSLPPIGNASDKRTLNQLCADLTKPLEIHRKTMREPSVMHPIPVQTAIGEKVTVAELCPGSNGSSSLDPDSVLLLMNHNTQAYVQAFGELNRSFDMNPLHDDMPTNVRIAKGCIEEVFKTAFGTGSGSLATAISDARALISQSQKFLDVFAEQR